MSKTIARQPWVVIKFGGKSVASRACWDTIAKLTQQHQQQGLRPLIVCSAISQMTNLLEQLLEDALQGKQEAALTKIQTRHQELATELDVDIQVLAADFTALTRLATGIALIGETTPRVNAKILAAGEQMLTRLGAEFLKQQGLNTAWHDSRDLLISVEKPHTSEQSRYLSAHCAYEQDAELQAKLAAEPCAIVITQGFVVANPKGETVVLGRGGSDTSAAYFAAKLGAARCEIWTDVPGIYTANPHQVPNAQVLKALDYDEAQEIAAMGGKVLHPRCLHPVKHHHIPMYVGCTFTPDLPGTLISVDGYTSDKQIKAILTRSDLVLVSIETVEMWQQVGFLADIFACFKRHSLSIDLISTSEFNVTVSLDLKAHAQDMKIVEVLLKDLNSFCKAKTIGPCGSISLVGRNIRTIFHQLGDAFAVFEEQQIHLISQAANDLNLTFVVDEDQKDRLAIKLHQLLFGEIDQTQNTDYSQTWWSKKRAALLALITEKQAASYVYDADALAANINNLYSIKNINRFFYAIKANNDARILTQFEAAKLGFECVSLEEVRYIFSLFKHINPQRIMFTPNFAPRFEYEAALKLGINVTIDNIYPLQHWPELFANKEIFLRLDPGQGYGHHKHVCTAGAISKFGIPLAQLPQVLELIKKHHIKVIGLHAHTGSGILKPDVWQQTAVFLAQLTESLPTVKYLNIGGGLGIAERVGQQALDLSALNASLQDVKTSYPHLEFWLEPGRYLVANAGVLLARVTQIKYKGELAYIGVETGMNSLIRPALYGSYHEVVNLSKLDAPRTQPAHIVGPICETGDTLAFARLMPDTQEGDVLLINNTGAYGHTMSSYYNMRAPAAEYYLAST